MKKMYNGSKNNSLKSTHRTFLRMSLHLLNGKLGGIKNQMTEEIWRMQKRDRIEIKRYLDQLH